MVRLSKRTAAKKASAIKASFCRKPTFRKRFLAAQGDHDVPVVDINLKLRPKILDLKPGTRIVSNTFNMGEWKADETATVTKTASRSAPPSYGSCRQRPEPGSYRKES